MAAPEERVKAWMTVDKQELWGTAGPFDLLEGGEEKVVKDLLAVTSDVKQFPADDAPYGSLLMGRLASQSDLPATSIAHLEVFVEMDKNPAHVKMWKAGVKSLEDINGAEDAKRSSMQGAEAGGRTRAPREDGRG